MDNDQQQYYTKKLICLGLYTFSNTNESYM